MGKVEATPAPDFKGPHPSPQFQPQIACSLPQDSDELARLSSPSADNIVRRKASRDVSAAVMEALLDDSNGGSSVKPASITNGLVLHDTLSGLFTDFEGDLERSVWCATPQTWLALQDQTNPKRTARRRISRLPAYASRFAPEGCLVLIDPTAVALAAGTMTFDSSKNASVQMDTTPSQESTTPTAAQQVSLYQTDATAIRLTWFVNWLVTRPNSVGILALGSPVWSRTDGYGEAHHGYDTQVEEAPVRDDP